MTRCGQHGEADPGLLRPRLPLSCWNNLAENIGKTTSSKGPRPSVISTALCVLTSNLIATTEWGQDGGLGRQPGEGRERMVRQAHHKGGGRRRPKAELEPFGNPSTGSGQRLRTGSGAGPGASQRQPQAVAGREGGVVSDRRRCDRREHGRRERCPRSSGPQPQRRRS